MLTLFGVMVSHSLLETARDSLFLASLPAEYLPWAYIGIAVAAILFIQAQALLPMGGGNRTILGTLLLLCAGITAGFWLLLRHSSPWVLGATYIWAGVFATLTVTRFWMVVGDVFSVTQAKRVFALIGAGSVTGAIVGSGTARALAELTDPRHFVLVAAGVMAVTGALPLLALRRRDRLEPAERDPDQPRCPNPLNWQVCTSSLRHHPYVRQLMWLVLLSTVVLTLADFLFKSIVAQEVEQGALAGFFSTTYFSLNLASLALQLTFVGFMLRRAGLQSSLATTPLLMGVSAVGLVLVVALSPALLLVAALALKGVDGGLRHSLHRTSLETLYVPLTQRVREQVKTFIDVIGQRGGQAVASVGILLVVLLPHPVYALGAVVALLSGLWIRWARRLHGLYLDIFRETLGEGRSRARLDFPELDLASLETLIARLNSDDDREVLAALDILEEQGRVPLIPALILYHPSPAIVIRALELFAEHGRKNIEGLLERCESRAEPEVRAAALRVRYGEHADVSRLLKIFLDDESAVVRVTALVALVSAGWIEGEEAETAVESIARDAPLDETLALLKSIQAQPSSIHTSLLLHQAQHEDEAVRLEVARAMRHVPDPRNIPVLLEMIAWRRLRDDARNALLAVGEESARELEKALADESLPQAVRRHIPRTLSRFEPTLVAPMLMGRLRVEPDGLVRYKILRALGHLRNKQPDLPLDEAQLDQAIEATVLGCYRLLDWQLQLEDGAREDPQRLTAVHRMLHAAILGKQRHALERLFRLLGLRHPDEDWQQIHRGLTTGGRADRASSQELIEARLSSPLREAVLGYVDDLPASERLPLGRVYYRRRPLGYRELLFDFIERGSLALRSLTYYHAGELALADTRAKLRERLDSVGSFEREALQRAISLYENPEEEKIEIG